MAIIHASITLSSSWFLSILLFVSLMTEEKSPLKLALNHFQVAVHVILMNIERSQHNTSILSKHIMNLNLFVSIIMELLAFACSPTLFITSNLVRSHQSLWILRAATVAPIIICLIAAHTPSSKYLILTQLVYWMMAWAILTWTNSEWLRGKVEMMS